MIINQLYQFILIVLNKEQRGSIPPAKFNNLAKVAQLEVIGELLGNNEQLNQVGVPPYGFKANRKVDESLRPLVYGPIEIPIRGNGDFDYPYGYMWPDAWSKTDFNPIKAISSDEYPFIKRSHVAPPTTDYPVMIFRNPYGFIDPFSVGSFKLSYIKRPPDPVWAYNDVNDEPVFNAGASIDFTLNSDFTTVRMAMKILQYCGINLNEDQIVAFGLAKETKGP